MQVKTTTAGATSKSNNTTTTTENATSNEIKRGGHLAGYKLTQIPFRLPGWTINNHSAQIIADTTFVKIDERNSHFVGYTGYIALICNKTGKESDTHFFLARKDSFSLIKNALEEFVKKCDCSKLPEENKSNTENTDDKANKDTTDNANK